ncbi:hypothetical protein EROM_020060 [Encephalitozoon romaleae SJ-2008]|uniref:Spore wall protein n=1 Tax=Encephalitozoon romaleae (strain SJ-2008) TaxID=1178016 RepID=I6ZS97_ENCRO|nr:hypothetical protein EROM_020060 [Encephalitozoon romaleae SJ-2008]AFN82481.1 hypothetical protein EROM_020060 [Encephalitozoon romaleae SJ-2008]
MFGNKYFLILLMGLEISSQAIGVRRVPVEVYISEAGRKKFLDKGRSIEDIVGSVAEELELKMNEHVYADRASTDKRKFHFDWSVSGMTSPEIDLDKCGKDTSRFQYDLVQAARDKPGASVILLYTCESEGYSEDFILAGQKTPLVIQRKYPECSNDVATFTETEPMKIESIIANALFITAGSPLNDMVEFEEVDNGRDGFKRDIRLKTTDFSLFSGGICH